MREFIENVLREICLEGNPRHQKLFDKKDGEKLTDEGVKVVNTLERIAMGRYLNDPVSPDYKVRDYKLPNMNLSKVLDWSHRVAFNEEFLTEEKYLIESDNHLSLSNKTKFGFVEYEDEDGKKYSIYTTVELGEDEELDELILEPDALADKLDRFFAKMNYPDCKCTYIPKKADVLFSNVDAILVGDKTYVKSTEKQSIDSKSMAQVLGLRLVDEVDPTYFFQPGVRVSSEQILVWAKKSLASARPDRDFTKKK